MYASDSRYEEFEALVILRAVLVNPFMHLLGYGKYERESEYNFALDNELIAQTVSEIDKKQSALLLFN